MAPYKNDLLIANILKEVEGNATSIDSSKYVNKYISEYKMITKLGRGAMGVVYEAHQKRLNRKVAFCLDTDKNVTIFGILPGFSCDK